MRNLPCQDEEHTRLAKGDVCYFTFLRSKRSKAYLRDGGEIRQLKGLYSAEGSLITVIGEGKFGREGFAEVCVGSDGQEKIGSVGERGSFESKKSGGLTTQLCIAAGGPCPTIHDDEVSPRRMGVLGSKGT